MDTAIMFWIVDSWQKAERHRISQVANDHKSSVANNLGSSGDFCVINSN